MRTNEEIDKALDKILEIASPEALAKKVDIPLQQSREAYVMKNSNPKTCSEFDDEIYRFSAHLWKPFYKKSIVERIDEKDDVTNSWGVEFLRKVFRGGEVEAFILYEQGLKGGMKRILDIITEQAILYWREVEVLGSIPEIATKLSKDPDESRDCAIMRRYIERFPDFVPDFCKYSAGLLVIDPKWGKILMSHVEKAEKIAQQVRKQPDE